MRVDRLSSAWKVDRSRRRTSGTSGRPSWPDKQVFGLKCAESGRWPHVISDSAISAYDTPI